MKSKKNEITNKESKQYLSPNPYVVSGDIVPLLHKWAKSKNFVLPSQDFFNQLRNNFSRYMKKIFPDFEFIHEDEIITGMNDIVSESGLQAISLDWVYYPTNPSLAIVRFVDEKGGNRGLGKRPDTPPIIQQFRQLKQLANKNIILIDDVIYSGDLLMRVTGILSKMGFRISLICAGIGISEGIERLIGAGYSVQCVRTYNTVIDEVCERDFYPGVPLSGRVLAAEKNIGVPYLLPFGNPEKWASIPSEWQVQFSKFCIQQTVCLFEEIERCSNKIVSCDELDRLVIMLPQDKTRFVDALQYSLLSSAD